MMRVFYLLFAAAAYFLFLAAFTYFALFVGNVPGLPITVDQGGPSVNAGLAAIVDASLIVLFGLQHSIMARPSFKAWWTQIVPPTIERSVYVLIATLLLILLIFVWHPLPGVVWSVPSSPVQVIMWVVFATGWLMAVFSTFLINHFELMGLQQVWQNFRGSAPSAPKFRQPLLYRWSRHPLYLGMVIGLWCTPLMTVGHLLLAAGMTIYILIGIRYEERDLVSIFGTEYTIYQKKIAMLIPWPKRSG